MDIEVDLILKRPVIPCMLDMRKFRHQVIGVELDLVKLTTSSVNAPIRVDIMVNDVIRFATTFFVSAGTNTGARFRDNFVSAGTKTGARFRDNFVSAGTKTGAWFRDNFVSAMICDATRSGSKSGRINIFAREVIIRVLRNSGHACCVVLIARGGARHRNLF